MEKLAKLISEKVILGPKPALYLSGGLDSTIILHYLRETRQKTGPSQQQHHQTVPSSN